MHIYDAQNLAKRMPYLKLAAVTRGAAVAVVDVVVAAAACF